MVTSQRVETALRRVDSGIAESPKDPRDVVASFGLRNALSHQPGGNAISKCKIGRNRRCCRAQCIEFGLPFDFKRGAKRTEETCDHPVRGKDCRRAASVGNRGERHRVTFAAGLTKSETRRNDRPDTMLITRWSGRKCSSDMTFQVIWGLVASTTISLSSRTSWLDAAMETPEKRLARYAAIPGLRGDNRMECRAATSELSPVTMADVIAPVPTNPSFIDSPILSQTAKRAWVRRMS